MPPSLSPADCQNMLDVAPRPGSRADIPTTCCLTLKRLSCLRMRPTSLQPPAAALGLSLRRPPNLAAASTASPLVTHFGVSSHGSSARCDLACRVPAEALRGRSGAPDPSCAYYGTGSRPCITGGTQNHGALYDKAGMRTGRCTGHGA